MRKCPHCGSDKGLYVTATLTGVKVSYSFTGDRLLEPLDLSDAKVAEAKRMYCKKCQSYICTTEDLKFFKYERDFN